MVREERITMHAKPFIKWVGGKTQLLNKIDNVLPTKFQKYIEPFVGGGAVLFHILEKYPDIKYVEIKDINAPLLTTYYAVKHNVHELIDELWDLQSQYYNSINIEEKKTLYLRKRKEYNELIANNQNMDSLIQCCVYCASLFIFLNKTCFNGLYRVNKRGEYNVPFGKSERPQICDIDNLLRCCRLLQKVNIIYGDYPDCLEFVDRDTFIYLDPPYLPISETSSFTSYTKDGFGIDEQIQLSEFCKKAHEKRGKFLLSNSYNIEFFGKHYEGFHIYEVEARRNINSDGEKRGKIKEILISNY